MPKTLVKVKVICGQKKYFKTQIIYSVFGIWKSVSGGLLVTRCWSQMPKVVDSRIYRNGNNIKQCKPCIVDRHSRKI